MPTISEISRDWGVSRPYVSRCVNQRGCPTSPLEAAREWWEDCASSRPPTNLKQIAKLLGDDDEGVSQPRTDNPPPPLTDSLHHALEAATAAQEQAHSLLLEGMGEQNNSKMAVLLALHNKALELRLKAEAQYRDALRSSQPADLVGHGGSTLGFLSLMLFRRLVASS